MTTLVSTVKSRLATIALAVSGVKRAYANAPQSLPDSDLPILVVFTGAATYTPLGETLAEETRTYLLRLYVAPVQAGYDGEAESRVEPFLTSARAKYLSHPLLGNGAKDSALPFVTRAAWGGDGGVMVLPYAGQNYIGAEFRVNVTTLVPIGVAAYE